MTAFPGAVSTVGGGGTDPEPGAWNLCTLFDVNHAPRRPEQLQQGLIDLARRIYDPSFVQERRQRFFRELRARRVVARALEQEGASHET